MVLNKESAEALVRLAVGLAANIAMVFGWTIDTELWVSIGLSIVAIAATVYGMWWKNNNVTPAAQAGQATVDYLKGEPAPELDEDELGELECGRDTAGEVSHG